MTTNVDRRSVNVGKTDWERHAVSGHSLRLFPLALQGSVSGARRAGLPMTTNDDLQSMHAGEADSREETGARRQKAGELVAIR